MGKTRKITICAIMTALGTVLSLVSKIIPIPWLQGGNITFASCVPIIFISIFFGCKWGLLSSIVFAFMQMIIGFYPPPVKSVLNFFLVIFLDYILAFGVYGFVGIFVKKDKGYTVSLSVLGVSIVRYLFHVISGILIWNVYAAAEREIIAYAVIYNGSYMLPETLITLICCRTLIKPVKRILGL